MQLRVAGLVTGIGLGFVFDWARLTDPNTFHEMLTVRSPDVYLLMGAAVAVATVGARLLRGRRALLNGEPISLAGAPVARRHVVGGLIFGTGWALASSCPGPLVAQVGSGRYLALATLATLAGVAGGIAGQVLLTRRAASAVPTARAVEVL